MRLHDHASRLRAIYLGDLIRRTVYSVPRLRSSVEHSRVPHALHEGHRYAHLAYCAFVFVEGHGMYATMGGVLFVIGALLTFGGQEVES